jgi:hypothetical protein
MKKTASFILAIMFSFSLLAQKQINDANAEVRQVKGFHAIRVSTGIELMLTLSSSEAVAVSASNTEDRARIKTVVEGGVLRIYFDNDDWKVWKNRKNGKLKAYVSAIKIDDLDINSGAQVNVEGELKTDKLGLDVSSGATFNGKVNVAGTLNVDQSSGSQIRISGTAADLKLDGSSGSTFNGYELAVDNAEVDLSSGSTTELTINKELSAEATSGGSVRYKGGAVIRNIKTGSGGAISRSR